MMKKLPLLEHRHEAEFTGFPIEDLEVRAAYFEKHEILFTCSPSTDLIFIKSPKHEQGLRFVGSFDALCSAGERHFFAYDFRTRKFLLVDIVALMEKLEKLPSGWMFPEPTDDEEVAKGSEDFYLAKFIDFASFLTPPGGKCFESFESLRFRTVNEKWICATVVYHCTDGSEHCSFFPMRFVSKNVCLSKGVCLVELDFDDLIPYHFIRTLSPPTEDSEPVMVMFNSKLLEVSFHYLGLKGTQEQQTMSLASLEQTEIVDFDAHYTREGAIQMLFVTSQGSVLTAEATLILSSPQNPTEVRLEVESCAIGFPAGLGVFRLWLFRDSVQGICLTTDGSVYLISSPAKTTYWNANRLDLFPIPRLSFDDHFSFWLFHSASSVSRAVMVISGVVICDPESFIENSTTVIDSETFDLAHKIEEKLRIQQITSDKMPTRLHLKALLVFLRTAQYPKLSIVIDEVRKYFAQCVDLFPDLFSDLFPSFVSEPVPTPTHFVHAADAIRVGGEYQPCARGFVQEMQKLENSEQPILSPPVPILGYGSFACISSDPTFEKVYVVDKQECFVRSSHGIPLNEFDFCIEKDESGKQIVVFKSVLFRKRLEFDMRHIILEPTDGKSSVGSPLSPCPRVNVLAHPCQASDCQALTFHSFRSLRTQDPCFLCFNHAPSLSSVSDLPSSSSSS